MSKTIDEPAVKKVGGFEYKPEIQSWTWKPTGLLSSVNNIRYRLAYLIMPPPYKEFIDRFNTGAWGHMTIRLNQRQKKIIDEIYGFDNPEEQNDGLA